MSEGDPFGLHLGADGRKVFLKALRETLGAALIADGFRGSGSHYRRFRDPVMHAINIQSQRGGGHYCVNLGIHLSFLPMAVGGLADPEKVREIDCEFRTRLATEGEHDKWWWDGSGDAEIAMTSATSIAELYRERGKPLLNQWIEFPGQFANVTVNDIKRARDFNEVWSWTSTVRAALAFSRVNLQLKKTESAREFAEYGLRNIGNASGLTASFEEILR